MSKAHQHQSEHQISVRIQLEVLCELLEGTAHKERDDVGGELSAACQKIKPTERAAKRNHGSRTNAIAGGVLHQEARHYRHRTGEQVRSFLVGSSRALQYLFAAQRAAMCGLRIPAHNGMMFLDEQTFWLVGPSALK